MRLPHRLLIAVAFAGCVAAAAAPQESAQENKQSEHAAHHASASQDMHKVMHEGATAQMKMTGDVDRDFATMMTMHHEQAIKMAELEIQHGSNAELKAIAEKMKAAQKKEIEELARFK